MGKTAQRPVMVTDEHGTQHRFAAGEEVPDELVARIDNDSVWEPVEYDADAGPDPTDLAASATVVATSPDGGVVLDAPYAHSSDEPEGVTDQAGRPPSLQPDSESTGSESSDESPEDGSKPSPEALDGMTRADLESTARSLGIEVPHNASKAQIRGFIDSAPDRPSGS